MFSAAIRKRTLPDLSDVVLRMNEGYFVFEEVIQILKAKLSRQYRFAHLRHGDFWLVGRTGVARAVFMCGFPR